MNYSHFPVDVETGYALDGATRVTLNNTLFDGKTLDVDNPFKWDGKGTGTQVFANSIANMNVDAGEYFIRQGKIFAPYFPAKSQRIEATSFNFHNEPGVVKRIGYFSTNGIAPYDTNKDGVWLEADGTTHRIICANNGVETHNIPLSQWDDHDSFDNYDWSKFTVICFDFLWLGGAALRFFVAINGTFKLIHTIRNHTGFATIPIFKNPQHPIRYEIRSTTGTGSLSAICSQISSEGSSWEQGQGVNVYNISKTVNSVGTNYLIGAGRKTASFRNTLVHLDRISLGITGATSDSGIIFLCLNPTYSATPTWVADSKIEKAAPTGAITVTNLGKVLQSIPIVSSNQSIQSQQAVLRSLLIGIDDVATEMALVYQPTTSNQVVSGSLLFFEY